MKTRLSLLATGLGAIACACSPVKRKYRVTYFQRVRIPDLKMYTHKRVRVEVMAYSALDAARQVDPTFEPGYNCWATRVFDREKKDD